jgi:hypothetical protein
LAPQQFCVTRVSTAGLRLILQAEDLRKLAEAGCAAVFMPASLYHQSGSSSGGSSSADGSMVVGAAEAGDPDAHETWVSVDHLSQGLCAKSRPHFFKGVCTVSGRAGRISEVIQPGAWHVRADTATMPDAPMGMQQVPCMAFDQHTHFLGQPCTLCATLSTPILALLTGLLHAFCVCIGVLSILYLPLRW